MAKITLPTNYRDDILNTSAEGKRKYVMSYNQDGTVSFEDVTPYEQVGSDFGAGDINTANEAINESFDKNKLVKDLDTINALTEEGFAPDALAVKQLNERLGDISSIGNETYNSVEKILRYYIDNGFLPDVDVQIIDLPLVNLSTNSYLKLIVNRNGIAKLEGTIRNSSGITSTKNIVNAGGIPSEYTPISDEVFKVNQGETPRTITIKTDGSININSLNSTSSLDISHTYSYK